MHFFRKFSFRILFSFAVVFCFGLHLYSNYNVNQCIAGLNTIPNNVEYSLISDFDSFGDDQINRAVIFTSSVEDGVLIPIPHNCKIINNYSFSIWQPPNNF
ncbi:MAG: hypothetical protein NT004_15630 [Bacteroidetes bacterium]|nr:hypothetical protein [Bacteroidota bacterium]